MSDRRKIISVIGNKSIEKDGVRYKLAYDLGKALVDNGYRVQSGGLHGVMSAVLEGAKASKNYKEGDTIALVPSFDTETANEYADIVIPTGLDMMRNAMVANAYAVVGIGGGAGTLCEYAFAWSLNRLLIAFENSGGWSEKLAGEKLDDTVRYPDIPEDKVYAVSTAKQAIEILNKYVDRYDKRHTSITTQDNLLKK
ncbi:MAG: acyl-CoA synthetase [Clostridiales bacterium]|nr:acyl-CoA synthetase [Clostridiales bacterium]